MHCIEGGQKKKNLICTPNSLNPVLGSLFGLYAKGKQGKHFDIVIAFFPRLSKRNSKRLRPLKT